MGSMYENFGRFGWSSSNEEREDDLRKLKEKPAKLKTWSTKGKSRRKH